MHAPLLLSSCIFLLVLSGICVRSEDGKEDGKDEKKIVVVFAPKPTKPTSAPYKDRVGLIHQILRAKVERVANKTEHMVQKGAQIVHHDGTKVADKVGFFIRKLGHKLVDMVVKVHEMEEWKKNLTEALANKNQNSLVDKLENHFGHFKYDTSSENMAKEILEDVEDEIKEVENSEKYVVGKIEGDEKTEGEVVENQGGVENIENAIDSEGNDILSEEKIDESEGNVEGEGNVESDGKVAENDGNVEPDGKVTENDGNIEGEGTVVSKQEIV